MKSLVPVSAQHSQGLPTVYIIVYVPHIIISCCHFFHVRSSLTASEHHNRIEFRRTQRPNQMSDPRDVYEPLWVMRKMNEF